MGVLVIVAVAITQALLQINKRAAIARVMNAAKAEAISRIQQVQQVSYNPDALPAVIPDILKVTATSPTPTPIMVDLGNSTTGLGSIPAKVFWSVATPIPSNTKIRSVQCHIEYTYLNKNLHYDLFTYRSPD